jgi:hypothetical protein
MPDIFSIRSQELLQQPQRASEKEISTLEKEVKHLIEEISKGPRVDEANYKRFVAISNRIHKVAELNPQLKNIDETFKKHIIQTKQQQPTAGAQEVPKLRKAEAAKTAAPAEVPRPPRENHINESVLKEWIETHPDPDAKQALTELTGHIRHVSQAEFEESLQATTQHLNTVLEREGGEYVIAVAKGKSNKWVAQLAMPHLSKEPKEEISLVFPLYLQEYVRRKAKNPNETFPKCIVLFDDAAYSGEQLSRVIRNILSSINEHNNRPGSVKIPIPKIIVASPYMTNFAEHAIKEKVTDFSVGQGREKHSATRYLEILPYNRIMSIKEQIPNQKTLNVLTQMWWPNELQLGRTVPGRSPFPADVESTRDLSPSQFAHKRGVESRGTTYFSFKIPDQDSFLGPLADGTIVMEGRKIALDRTFEIIPRTVPPYKPNFDQFCKEITS